MSEDKIEKLPDIRDLQDPLPNARIWSHALKAMHDAKYATAQDVYALADEASEAYQAGEAMIQVSPELILGVIARLERAYWRESSLRSALDKVTTKGGVE